ncbi:MAG: porin family protein [Firmicutes bacterium]|nr:porin family protein [Bacillota bacterium]
MKAYLAIIFALVLSLALAVSAAAAPILFYFDTLPNGSVEKGGAVQGKDDLTFSIVSGGTMFGKFKVGAEYGIGKIKETGGDKDASLWSIKGGYRLLDLRATKLDGIVATIVIDTERGAEKTKLDSIHVGVDFTQYFSEQLFLAASVVYAVDGSYDYGPGKDDDTPVSLYRFKLHYLLNENWGAVLGYTKLNYEFDFTVPVIGKANADVSLGGWHLGVLYLFR